MNCRQARNLYGAYWDDELTQAEREALESHFSSCPTCRSSYEEFGRALEMVGSLPRVEVAPDFAEHVLARTRRAATEPDRLATSSPRWIPITAAAALLAVLGTTLIQWAGLPLAPTQRDAALATRAIEQPVLVTPSRPIAGSHAPGAGTGSDAAMATAVSQVPDSLFDHSEDVEFILDPVTLKKGRAHTVLHAPQDPTRGQQAVITF
jgi:anti-sigma factor RsiW